MAMCDGSVRSLRLDGLSADRLRKLLEVGGCADERSPFANTPYGPVNLNWPNIAALAVWLLSVGALLTLAVRSRKQLSVPPTPAAS